MQFKKVRVSGFERIFEGMKNCYKEKRQGFGDQLFDFLSHSMVSYELTDITTIELFYLKKFSTSIKIIDKVFGNFIDQEKQFDIHQKIECILDTHNEILNDEDINKEECNIENILPIGCEKYHVIAIFKGSGITSITGPFIGDIFKVDGKFPDIYNGDFLIENKMAELFYSSFYTFISNQITNIDIVTEFMMNKKFYQYSEECCSLAHVNTPFGDIVFFGNTNDKLQNQIKRIKEGLETSPYHIKDQIYLTFVLDTTFSAFMKLFLNTNYVTDHENLKIVFLKEMVSLSDSILEKYNARISNSLDYLISYKKELNNSSNIDLNKFNFICNGNKIVYSVSISLSGIENIYKILEIEDELMEIKSIMSNYANIINNLIG